MEYQATEKKIALQLEFIGDKVASINTDKKRIKQVLLNLVSNALKFTFTGSIKVIISYENLSNIPEDEILVSENEISLVNSSHSE